MIRKEAWHDPCVSQKGALGVLNRPTRNAVFNVRCAIAVEFLVDLDLINRTALVGHYLRIGMHLSKSCAMLVMPRAEPQSLRLDHWLNLSRLGVAVRPVASNRQLSERIPVPADCP